MASEAAHKIAVSCYPAWDKSQGQNMSYETLVEKIDAAIQAATEAVWVQHREQLATRDRVWHDKLNAAVLEEREACLQIALKKQKEHHGPQAACMSTMQRNIDMAAAAKEIAAAIRQRSRNA